jgi:alpha-ketoglutarate-dependent taurine dioxygenase
VHQTSAYDLGDRKPRKDGRGTGPFVSLHPLVRLHPETREKVLFFNAGTISHIAGLKERESHHLLELLYHEATRPEYQVRFRWSPKALVVWDNAAVTHAGPIDYAQFDLPRVVRRITVAGELPEGPGGFRSRPLEGELFNVLG